MERGVHPACESPAGRVSIASTAIAMEDARRLARSVLLNLEAHRRRIDDLNVYPVPDGDTGTNLTLTVQAVVQALECSQAADAGAAARELTRAALMGARGNSGAILSQIVRGFAEVAGTSDALDGPALARAFRSASDAAHRAVRRPVEGTMLSVVREEAAPELDRLVERVRAEHPDAFVEAHPGGQPHCPLLLSVE